MVVYKYYTVNQSNLICGNIERAEMFYRPIDLQIHVQYFNYLFKIPNSNEFYSKKDFDSTEHALIKICILKSTCSERPMPDYTVYKT